MAVTVYSGGHNQADLTLDAVTIGVESNDPSGIAGDAAVFTTDYCVNHKVVLSIRVHTAFANQPHNQAQTVAVLDAVITKLKRNLRLATDYLIAGFSAAYYRESFPESGTQGGQVNVELHVLAEYRQE